MNARIKLLFVLVLLHSTSDAQIFVCKDVSGRTYTSDRPIPECTHRVVRELNKQGILVREIAPPLTAEEKQQKQLQLEKLQAEAAVVAERKKSDRALLARYHTEADIETARARALDMPQDRLKRESDSLAAIEKQLPPVREEISSYEKKKAVPPITLRHFVEDSEQSIADSKKIIEERNQEIIAINEKFDQIVKRFREIVENAAEK